MTHTAMSTSVRFLLLSSEAYEFGPSNISLVGSNALAVVQDGASTRRHEPVIARSTSRKASSTAIRDDTVAMLRSVTWMVFRTCLEKNVALMSGVLDSVAATEFV